jgi:hypothetical protein
VLLNHTHITRPFKNCKYARFLQKTAVAYGLEGVRKLTFTETRLNVAATDGSFNRKQKTIPEKEKLIKKSIKNKKT